MGGVPERLSHHTPLRRLLRSGEHAYDVSGVWDYGYDVIGVWDYGYEVSGI